MSVRPALLLLASVPLFLSACADDPEPSTLNLDDTTTSASPSSPPSEATSGPTEIPTSYPEAGLEFDSLPDVTGTERAALEAYIDYERGLRLMSRTAEANALITESAGPALTPVIESTLKHLRSNNLRYQGTVVVSVTLDGAGGEAAVLDLCTDGTDLELVRDGTPEPIKGLKVAAGRVVVTNNGGTWTVTQYDTLEETC